ncbi:MAG: hypothetical protein WBM03_14725 [Steroidobacteraceae bacterium]
MRKRRRSRAQSKQALLLAAMTAGGAAIAADVPPLPAGFLEYLGSWEADDADWVVANAATVVPPPAASSAASKLPNPTTIEKRGAVQAPATTERKP